MSGDLIFKEYKFKDGEFDELSDQFLQNYPILYILYNNNKKPVAYIGQTVNAKKRMKDHLKNTKRDKLTDTLLIGNKKFNQSATYNLETNLINHFLADEKYILQNVSQTSSKQTIHNYYCKEYYDKNVFTDLWNSLINRGFADNSSDVLKNKDIYKLSPFHELSDSQLETKNEILDYCRNNINSEDKKIFFIEGEAGTGKSVVLSSLFNEICGDSVDKSSKLYKTNNYLLVNHPEVLKTYQTMAGRLPHMKKKQIKKPTSFINEVDRGKSEKSDITIVDEAHLLLTNRDSYNNFYYQNQLDEIIERSKITIVIFDPKQVVKLKSNWSTGLLRDKYRDLHPKTLTLKEQFRMQADEEIINWIDKFVSKEILPLPEGNSDFTFHICQSADELKTCIKELNDKYKLSRIVASFDYEHKKDGGTYIVDPSGINLPWNSTDSNEVWAENEKTINEVGSIYTVQGFDLNYVGVVIGPSIDYDEVTDRLVIDTSKYQDKGAFNNVDKLKDDELEQDKERIILNSLNILLKRGVHGLFIYAVNEKLRKKLLSLQNKR